VFKITLNTKEWDSEGLYKANDLVFCERAYRPVFLPVELSSRKLYILGLPKEPISRGEHHGDVV
jgi:hypothetical protein